MDIETINPLDLPSVSFEERSALPDLPGIYFVLDTNNTVLYIGKAVRLMLRWRNRAHHRYSQIAGIGNVRIAWLLVSDAGLLPAIEAACIKHFAPQFNRTQIVAGPDDLVVMTFKISPRLRDQVRELAAEERRTFSAQFILLLEEGLALSREEE